MNSPVCWEVMFGQCEAAQSAAIYDELNAMDWKKQAPFLCALHTVWTERGKDELPPVANENGKTNSKISNDRLPLKQGSVRFETLRKRVSDNPQHFVFRRRFFFGNFWSRERVLLRFCLVFEELRQI